jgi:hypothetical protein
MTRGFTLSVAVLLAALVVAVTMIPRWMRAAQAEVTDDTLTASATDSPPTNSSPGLAD